MSALKGNLYMIYHEARWMMVQVLFLYVILPLMVLWVLIGLLFNLTPDVATAIPVPVYINIVIIAVMGFKSLYLSAVSLGSTRVQYLKAFYLVGLASVFTAMLLLNICQYLLKTVYQQLFGWSNILHPGLLVQPDYHFLTYFWVDLMVGLFLFGLTFLIYSLWHRLGTSRVLLIAMIFLSGTALLYYGGTLSSWYIWLLGLQINISVYFILLGATGLLALFLTYPLMRNAPLQPKPRMD
jgi:hypothetical protein